jgi:hypothetical protein
MAAGGKVTGSSGSMPNLGKITLNLGGREFEVLTEKKVAKALKLAISRELKTKAG